MTIDAVNDEIYSIEWFMSFGDGTSKEEIEYVIAYCAFEVYGSQKYNRQFGGSFEILEQQTIRLYQKINGFTMRLVNSIYRINQYRNFDPYIVVGGEFVSYKMVSETKLNVLVMWVLQQDLTKVGVIQI